MPDFHTKKICAVCGEFFPRQKLYPLGAIRPSLLQEIERVLPEIDHAAYICQNDLSRFRTSYIQSLLVREKGEISGLEANVIESLKNDDLMSMEFHSDSADKFTFGQRMADRIAAFGGSWTFLIIFFIFLLIWMIINSVLLLAKPFDPFPFILLNLILSCIAAIQAPVIMMSQNRQEAKDRVRAEHDYQINLKAELEIRHLHEKMDHLLMQQWERLVEIQQVQIELLEELKAEQ